MDYLLRLQVIKAQNWGLDPSLVWSSPSLLRLFDLFLTVVLLQESISDFYWYYSGKEVIDETGKRNFSKALSVAKQIFNSLTEYIQVRCWSLAQHCWVCQVGIKIFHDVFFLHCIFFLQGPCIGNQQSLAHSRLWDAVVGFLHVFANMQMKLSQVWCNLYNCNRLIDFLISVRRCIAK